jgi:hypothetical protein
MSRPMRIDTDSHIIEPSDLWRKRLPSTWGEDRVIHIECSDDLQAEVWCEMARSTCLVERREGLK